MGPYTSVLSGPRHPAFDRPPQALGSNGQVTVAPIGFRVIKIKEIVASIEELRATALKDKVIVQGIIHEQVFFVATDNVVRLKVENIAFSHSIEVPGVDPEKVQSGKQKVDVSVDIEFIISEIIEGGAAVKQKIVLIVDVTVTEQVTVNGTVMDVVVGHARQQVLVLHKKVFPVIAVEVIQVPVAAVVQEQVLLVAEKRIEAIKIKRIDATILNVSATVLTDQVVVTGVVRKQVSFVGFDNVVRHQEEDIPFSHVLKVPGITPGTAVTPEVVVEFIVPELNVAEGILKQKIVIIVRVVVPSVQTVQVVTDVTGPGIVTQKVTLRVGDLTFTAVTDVTGPGIVQVKKITILAVVVGSPNPNPQPVVVVTDVIFAI